MRLVEKHQIKPSHINFKEIDHLAFLSKNLYNSTLYVLRHQYFDYQKFRVETTNKELKFKWITYPELAHDFVKQNQPDFRALPANVSQQVMQQAFSTFKTFWSAIKAYWKNPSKFTSAPKIPGYKDKISGRNVVVYTQRVINSKLKLTNTNINLKPKTKSPIKQVRIIQQSSGYCIEIVYDRVEKITKPNNNIASIDPGLNNLATITFNKKIQPLIIPGGPIKSINQYYNKKKGQLQSRLPKQIRSSKSIKALTQKRTNKINNYMHKASRFLINHLVSQSITSLVIGKNTQWKQEINIGSRNNQNFVQAPIARFIDMVKYKAELEGIKVIFTEESYTSKCSFLDQEELVHHAKYAGVRVKRGLFKTSLGRLLNADVNGSLNIMRKAIPNSHSLNGYGIEGVVVHPRIACVSENMIWSI